EGRVAILTVNRPDKLNALNEQVRRETLEHLERIESDDEIGVVIITGAGEKAFIAGADIGEFAGRSPFDQRVAMRSPRVFDVMATFPKPVIAMINGYCLGGGCELSMACDFRLASSRARLGQPEVNLGIIPGGGGTQRLPRLVGEGHAMRLIMTGELITAEEAERIGLVEKVFEPEALLEETLAMARTIASRSPIALQAAKESVLAARRMPLDAGLGFERAWFGLLFSTEDKNEGVDAFLAKRDPEFKGT
ncbi:MAG TPA: enoyl-CoA hydratase-related protein, partial [Gemmatimonadota bacterium]|nr:enoyl-CoA hydratase-related protein [Gemmatimonadota bacterium]